MGLPVVVPTIMSSSGSLSWCHVTTSQTGNADHVTIAMVTIVIQESALGCSCQDATDE